MTRAVVVGGPAAGRVEHPLGRRHKDRWRIALRPRLELYAALDGSVPTYEPVRDVVTYEVRQFRAGQQDIFVLALPEWSDAEVLGELLSVYQQVKAEQAR